MSRFIIFFLSILPFASAQETLFRQVFDTKTNTYVEATALFSTPSLGGYHPVRVVIANNQKIPHKIFLNFKDSTTYPETLFTTSNFTFTAEPNKTVTYDILVPLAAHNGSYSTDYYLEVSLTGTMGKTKDETSAKFTPQNPAVLLSETLHSINASALDTEILSRGYSSHYGSSPSFSSRFNSKQLPDDWRAFSGFDTIMMTDIDWTKTPPGSRNAIISWVRLGGQLVIYSQSNSTLPSLGLPSDPSFGEILIKPIGADLRLTPAAAIDIAFHSGSTKTRMNAITNDFNTSWPTQNKLGTKTFNYVSFIIILIAFGIIVGPVNLFVFAKSGRRHRLFVTTPIISIVTSLILIILIILQDGFGGDGRRTVLMEVRPDENQNAAFILQEQFARTGVMTSSSFSMDSSAFIAPVPIDKSRWSRFTSDYGTRGNYDIQPASGKLFASGSWFQSRSEQGHLITAVVPTRGRIEATDEPTTFISTFDFNIETLLYKDPSGNWHRASDIKKGKRTSLTAIDPTMVQPILNDLSNKLTDRSRSYFRQVQGRDDHFVAFTNQAPAVDTHSSIDWKTSTIITGPIAR